MKITDLSVIFILILLAFALVTGMKIENQHENHKRKVQYNLALQAAVQDAGKSLLLNESQTYESQYESLKRVKTNKEAALQAFFQTLFINFKAQYDPITQDLIKAYLPAILVIDYDGFYVYAVDEYYNAEGELIREHLWTEKKPYTYSDDIGNSLLFTLDDYVITYDVEQNEWKEGFLQDLRSEVNIPLLNDADLFENVRRSTIVQAIQDELEYQINHHNTYARRFGITYTFTLPLISSEDWNNTINDVGFIAFIQGIPIGTKQFNNYAFGGSRLIKKHNYYGIRKNGLLYYLRSDCDVSERVIETFATAKEAAQSGYHPLSCN